MQSALRVTKLAAGMPLGFRRAVLSLALFTLRVGILTSRHQLIKCYGEYRASLSLFFCLRVSFLSYGMGYRQHSVSITLLTGEKGMLKFLLLLAVFFTRWRVLSFWSRHFDPW